MEGRQIRLKPQGAMKDGLGCTVFPMMFHDEDARGVVAAQADGWGRIRPDTHRISSRQLTAQA